MVLALVGRPPAHLGEVFSGERVIRIDTIHKLLMTVDIGQLIDKSCPVADHAACGICPTVIKQSTHLHLANGNRTVTARTLGISREGLRKKMKRLGLS